MVNKIKIVYNLDGIDVCLTAEDDWEGDRLVRQLGQMFAKVVSDMGYNPQIVLDDFKCYCECSDEEEK